MFSELNSNSVGILTNLKKRSPKNSCSLRRVPRETEANPREEAAQLAVDIYENAQDFIIVAPLAGVDPEEVQVQIKEDVVVIEGERIHPLAHTANTDKLVNECFFGPFLRSIVLPEAIDSKKALAEFKKNVLIITLPKLDSARTRIVKINKTEWGVK